MPGVFFLKCEKPTILWAAYFQSFFFWKNKYALLLTLIALFFHVLITFLFLKKGTCWKTVGEHLLDLCLFFFKLKYSLTDYFPMFPLCTFLMFSTGTENKKVTLGSNGLILLNWDLNCDQSAKNCSATLLKRLQDFLFSGGIKRWYWAVLG